MGRQEKLLEVLPPLDWDKVGTETWGDVVKQVRKVGVRTFAGGMLSRDPATRAHHWDAVFQPVRQPDWWQGDAEYHPRPIPSRSPNWNGACRRASSWSLPRSRRAAEHRDG